MDPYIFGQVPWYGLLIGLGVLIGLEMAVELARQRGLDPERLRDMVLYLVIGSVVGARLVYVLTSPSAFFGPNGDPLSALYVWNGGISFHGGVLGGLLALWLYARKHKLNMWAYADTLTPGIALGIMGGRLGNFMNGSDTTGRLTGSPLGFTWPEPGADTFGVIGRFIFGDNLWWGYPGICSLGAEVSLLACTTQGGEIVRGPVHLTQLYGFIVGFLLLFIALWALQRSRTPGYAFWQFALWYSVLRFVLEEPFRDNPLYWNVLLSEGVNQAGIGLFTLTQLVSIPIILLSVYMLLTLKPAQTRKSLKPAVRPS